MIKKASSAAFNMQAIIVSSLLLAGCASNAYMAPNKPSFETAKNVKADKKKSWNTIVKTLSSEGFTVKRLDQKQGTITLAYSLLL